MFTVTIVQQDGLDKKQKRDITKLQSVCFGHLDPEEIKEDFCCQPTAHVLAHSGSRLVGWAGVYKRAIEYQDTKIKIGGFGLCTHPDWRRLGVATKMSLQALGFLKQGNCDLAFLSIDLLEKGPKKLYQKLGFVELPSKFFWQNRSGKIKADYGGMILPLCSQKLFNEVLQGRDVFYIGKGYW